MSHVLCPKRLLSVHPCFTRPVPPHVIQVYRSKKEQALSALSSASASRARLTFTKVYPFSSDKDDFCAVGRVVFLSSGADPIPYDLTSSTVLFQSHMTVCHYRKGKLVFPLPGLRWTQLVTTVLLSPESRGGLRPLVATRTTNTYTHPF